MEKGHYDEEAEKLIRELRADALALIVLGGPKGSGFSLCIAMPTAVYHLGQSSQGLARAIARALREAAEQIENGSPCLPGASL